MSSYLTTEELEKTVKVYEESGRNQVKAAEQLKIQRSTLQNRLRIAAQRGIGQDLAREPLPVGQAIWGISSLVDGYGKIRLQWIKTKVDDQFPLIEGAIHDAFKQYEGKYSELPPGPNFFDEDILTVYNLGDLHLGLYSWKVETGADYDLDIAEKLTKKAVGDLVAQTPSSETAVLLNLGDFFHSDSNENRTRKSGNVLDVDTRFAKVLQIGVSLMVHFIQLALQKHEYVIVRNIPGNHDPYGTLALSVALAAFFHDDVRVTIDTSPDPFWFFMFGKVLLGATHGDTVSFDKMPMVMAGMKPKEWGQTDYRYIYLGHVHHKSKGGGEFGGAIWESFQTLAPKDAWHHQNGYISGRSIVAITHHRDKGEVYRHTVSVSPR